MRRRSAEGDEDLPGVEILDDDAASLDAPADEPSDVGRPRSNTLLTVLGVAGVFGLLFLLGTVGNEPPEVASPTTAPTTTEQPNEPESTDTTQRTREDRLAAAGVLLGDGPALQWHWVGATVNTNGFSWRNDEFISDDGNREVRVGLVGGVVSIDERPSVLLEFPEYRLSGFGGARLLIPIDDVDHVLVVPDSGEPVRVELPSIGDQPDGELVRSQTWVNGDIIDNRFVANQSTYTEADIGALGRRLDIDLSGALHIDVSTDRLVSYTRSGMLDDIVFAETDLTESEISQLRQINNDTNTVFSIDLSTGESTLVDLPDLQWLSRPLQTSDDELRFVWNDTSGASWRSSTTDGVEWSTEPSEAPIWFVDSGSQLVDVSGGSQIRRSVDGGETWESTRSPRRESETIAAGDVIVVGRSWINSVRDPVVVETNNSAFEFVLTGPEPQFEIRRSSAGGEVVLTGYLWDEVEGVTWDFRTGDITFSDPTTGEELLRVTGEAIGVAQAMANPMDEIALTRWAADQEQPTWQLASPTELFGAEALSVQFVGGGEQLLAIVTTPNGYELHIADTRA